MKKPELLSPAGDLEKLKMSIIYGADAVYLAGSEFGMRTASDNFTPDELTEGVKFTHSRGARVYVTCNTVPRMDEMPRMPEFLKMIAAIGVDAVIVTDLGVLNMVKNIIPNMEIHISTQANTVSFHTANAWYAMGAKRVVLARELSLEEIKEIRDNTPSDLEIECFVHGAMCMSYSGRCLLSSYMTGRDANRGNCAQSCRWKYSLMEEKRPGEYFPIFEDENGSFIMNSKDMNMINHIPELVNAGIDSFKIEGRVKTAYYTATITNAYRKAIDLYAQNPDGFALPQSISDEVHKVSHRDYYTGFYFGNAGANGQIYDKSSYIRDWDICASVDGYDEEKKLIECRLKNFFSVGEVVEALCPGGDVLRFTVDEMFDESGSSISTARHAEMKLFIPYPVKIPAMSMLRKERKV